MWGTMWWQDIFYNTFACVGLKNNPSSCSPCSSDLTGMQGFGTCLAGSLKMQRHIKKWDKMQPEVHRARLTRWLSLITQLFFQTVDICQISFIWATLMYLVWRHVWNYRCCWIQNRWVEGLPGCKEEETTSMEGGNARLEATWQCFLNRFGSNFDLTFPLMACSWPTWAPCWWNVPAHGCDAWWIRRWFGGQAGRMGHVESGRNKRRMTFK